MNEVELRERMHEAIEKMSVAEIVLLVILFQLVKVQLLLRGSEPKLLSAPAPSEPEASEGASATARVARIAALVQDRDSRRRAEKEERAYGGSRSGGQTVAHYDVAVQAMHDIEKQLIKNIQAGGCRGSLENENLVQEYERWREHARQLLPDDYYSTPYMAEPSWSRLAGVGQCSPSRNRLMEGYPTHTTREYAALCGFQEGLEPEPPEPPEPQWIPGIRGHNTFKVTWTTEDASATNAV